MARDQSDAPGYNVRMFLQKLLISVRRIFIAVVVLHGTGTGTDAGDGVSLQERYRDGGGIQSQVHWPPVKLRG